MKAPINETLAVGLMAVIMLVSLENSYESRLDAAFDLGTENGKNITKLEMKESVSKQVTDDICKAWWFGGDTKRVGEAIKKVKLQ